MDSVTLLYDMKDRIAMAVSFNYGSNHNLRELGYACMHCERLNIRHVVINLDFMHGLFKSSLLEGGDAVPDGHYAEDNMHSTVVPFRNGIMLAIATGLAESEGLRYVMMASHGGDHARLLLFPPGGDGGKPGSAGHHGEYPGALLPVPGGPDARRL